MSIKNEIVAAHFSIGGVRNVFRVGQVYQDTNLGSNPSNPRIIENIQDLGDSMVAAYDQDNEIIFMARTTELFLEFKKRR